MKSKNVLLLRILLKSTSQFNILRKTKDKKKRGRIIGNMIGFMIVFICLMAYCIITCVGYGKLGMIKAVPMMCATLISFISFLFTILKTNGYLFNFKEYDMLMSLPFEVKTIAADKFLYMYIKSLPWFMSISLSMMIGYAMYADASIIVYPIWIILTFVIPVIPMLAASFIGFVIARVSSGFKKTNIVQTILMMAFILLCFCSRFIIDGMFKNGNVENTLETVSTYMNGLGNIYLPVGWFCNAITEYRISDMFLLVGVTIILFELVFIPVSRSYRRINSAISSHKASHNYKMSLQKKKSLVNTIAYKEFKRMLGSSTYMTNIIIGDIMAFILGIVVLVIGVDRVLATVTSNAPISAQMIYPAIPMIVYFLIGMVPSTVCSPSLEGKNYWIIQSLPVKKKVLYQGKMLFNMYLTVPFMTFTVICLCVSAKVPVYSTVLYVIEGILLCGISTAWGCVCGIKFMRLDWENEVEVIKQGTAVSVYLFSNMFITMLLVVLVVFLGFKINPDMVTIGIIIMAAIMSAGFYVKAIDM